MSLLQTHQRRSGFLRGASFAIALAGILLSNRAFADDAKDAEEVLKAKGIRKFGAVLVAVEEAELTKALSEEKKLKKEVFDAMRVLFTAQQKEAQAKQLLAQYRQQRRLLNLQIDQTNNIEQRNRMVTLHNEINERISLMQESKEIENEVKRARDAANSGREKYIEHVLAMRKLADKIQQQWADAAADPDAKAAVAKLNQATGKAYALAESRSFQTQLRSLQKVEELVLSESIDLRERGVNTFMVSVTIGGKHTNEMCVDSGASIMCLPHKMASEMGLAPGEGAETVILQLADGSRVQAKQITIPSVRVGKFAVENVEAAVMPADLTDAAPLLGMSYLRNFKFDIDSSAKKLTMTRLETPGVTPKGGKK